MRTIEISPKTIALLIATPLVLYFIWIIKDLLFSLLIAFILMSALKPGVSKLVERNVPRGLAVGLVYLVFLAFFVLLISIIIPPIIYETANLIKSAPSIINQINPTVRDFLGIETVTQYVPSATNQVFQIISTVFSNTLFIMSTLFFSFYFLMDEDAIQQFFKRYLDHKNAAFASETLEKAEKRMASWFWGEITLMTLVGCLTYVGLLLLGVKYALPLAVLAGLLEVVPNMGPIISAIPALIIGFTQSTFIGVSTAALYLIVQQLENNVIVPMVMRRAVGINPIITLIALLVGGRIGGVLGVLLSIPALLFAETILTEYLQRNKKASEKVQE